MSRLGLVFLIGCDLAVPSSPTSSPTLPPTGSVTGDTGTEPGLCEDGETSTAACGLNLEGTRTSTCVDGAWIEDDACADSDVCVTGAREPNGAVCGFNDEGFLWQDCIDGQWVASESCAGTDACRNGAMQPAATACADDPLSPLVEECTEGAWALTETCAYAWLGDGECRQGDGSYALTFRDTYSDLSPHTDKGNADEAGRRCRASCETHRDWCLAFEVITTDTWSTPQCTLVTDRATFEGAGQTLDEDEWGGTQVFADDDRWQTYCGGTGDCTGTDWSGGSLNPREGYVCYHSTLEACAPGETKPVTCGLNDEGEIGLRCAEGAWEIDAECDGPDVCVNGTMQLGETPCGDTDGRVLMQWCEDGQWTDTKACPTFSHLGEGECRQGNGAYPLKFSRSYGDLSPHTESDNALQATLRCQDKCSEHADWCLAVEVVVRDVWSTPTCRLVTDRATFEGAGETLENKSWGGSQTIDGESYQTYCAGGGGCDSTDWDGGSLNPRAGYHCHLPL